MATEEDTMEEREELIPSEEEPTVSGLEMKIMTSDEDTEEDTDSDDDDYPNDKAKCWLLEPAVRKNRWIMAFILFLFVTGILCFIGGIALEILYHTLTDNVLRGVAFLIISMLILLPTSYAIIHVYLAAKRVGRVRFSSVWFFPY